MIAEIIGVGTELLLGQIANTNAQFISQALAAIGVDVHHHVVVGDNLQRIVETLRVALGRSDAVIVTGGLGPTPDDITREGVAAVLGVPLERDERLVQEIRDVFQRLGRHMPEDNLRQADLPRGAMPIDPHGTAPGFIVEHDGRIVCALPGVPWEMKAMLQESVLPLLRARSGDASLVSREVLVAGLGESLTHEKIADIVENQTNPTVAFLAGGGLVRVRLSAKAGTEADALALIKPVEDDIRALLGEAAITGNHATLGAALGEMLRARGATVAVAESLTGGLVGYELTKVSGSGDYFLGSLVVYSTESKSALAGVDEAILEGPGAVSEEAAVALAKGAAERFGADLGLATTGVAGPSEQEGKAVGTIYVAAVWEGTAEARRVRGYGDRENVRSIAVNAVLDLGRRLMMRNGGE